MTDPAPPTYSDTVETGDQHTAAAFGNTGVTVVGTPALIGFLETAAARCARPLIGPGDATVGTRVDIQHLAPAPSGATVTATATLIGRTGRRVSFAVEARWGDVVLMTGTHERAIVDLDRFLARLPGAPPTAV